MASRDVAFFVMMDDKLVVEFGEGRNIAMELKDEEDKELVETLLGDVNFWANFITSLSSAITQHK